MAKPHGGADNRTRFKGKRICKRCGDAKPKEDMIMAAGSAWYCAEHPPESKPVKDKDWEDKPKKTRVDDGPMPL